MECVYGTYWLTRPTIFLIIYSYESVCIEASARYHIAGNFSYDVKFRDVIVSVEGLCIVVHVCVLNRSPIASIQYCHNYYMDFSNLNLNNCTHESSGVARGVHVGSFAPNHTPLHPLLCRCRLVCLPNLSRCLTHCMHFYYTATAI